MHISFTNKWAKWLFWGVVIVAGAYIIFTVLKPSASISLGFGQPKQ